MDSLQLRTHNGRTLLKWGEQLGGRLAAAICIGVNGPQGDMHLMVSDELSRDTALELLRMCVAEMEKAATDSKIIKGNFKA